MDVKIITNLGELAAYQPHWEKLAEGLPLQGWTWQTGWWEIYGEQGHPAAGREMACLLVTDGPNVVAIAPWYRCRCPRRGWMIQFWGDGEICTDHCQVLCRESDHARVASTLTDWLTNHRNWWDVLELSAVDASDKFMATLRQAMLEQGQGVESPAQEHNCWVLTLPTSWEEYERIVSKSHRKQLRRSKREYIDSERVRLHVAQSPQELAEAWEILVALHQARRLERGDAGCFSSPRFEAFHKRVCADLLLRGELQLQWIELDGKPLAAEYMLRGHHTLHAYQGGLDVSRLDLDPGRLSLILTIGRAISQELAYLDFMRGDEPYKPHWRAEPIAAQCHRFISARPLAQLRAGAARASRNTKAWIKSAIAMAAATDPTKAYAKNVSTP